MGNSKKSWGKKFYSGNRCNYELGRWGGKKVEWKAMKQEAVMHFSFSAGNEYAGKLGGGSNGGVESGKPSKRVK